MVDTFPPGVLVPNPAAYPASDVATFADISAAALMVCQHCLFHKEEAGMPKWTGWSWVGMFICFSFLSRVVSGCVWLFVGILMGMVWDNG